tara:strand:- start:2106 stop:2852 length:747 start_codon:yes stop_codon:yes gene_type:complete
MKGIDKKTIKIVIIVIIVVASLFLISSYIQKNYYSVVPQLGPCDGPGDGSKGIGAECCTDADCGEGYCIKKAGENSGVCVDKQCPGCGAGRSAGESWCTDNTVNACTSSCGLFSRDCNPPKVCVENSGNSDAIACRDPPPVCENPCSEEGARGCRGDFQAICRDGCMEVNNPRPCEDGCDEDTGFCEDPPVDPSEDDPCDECTADQICVGNKCICNPQQPSCACVSDSDCQVGYACTDDQCKPIDISK